MPTYGTVNNTVYTDVSFNATNYANRLQQLIGDFFDHAQRKYAATSASVLAVGTGSKNIVINNNFSSATPSFGIGMCALLSPTTGLIGADRSYRSNWMFGVITSVSSNTLTVNVLAARGSGTFGSWNVSYIGDGLQTIAGVVGITNGGTNNSTIATSRNNLGMGDPTALSEGIFEDFIGGITSSDGAVTYDMEQWKIWSAPQYSLDFQANASKQFAGDSSYYNITPSDDVQIILADDYAAHPGVVVLGGSQYGSVVITLDNAVFDNNNFMQRLRFPYTGDILEVEFMIPANYSLTEGAGFAAGFYRISGAGNYIVVGVGTIPYPFNLISGSLDPTINGPMTFYVSTCSTAAGGDALAAAVYTTGFQCLPGVWYKARLDSTGVCNLYRLGNIVANTISGISFPSVSAGGGNYCRPCMGYQKPGGSNKSAVLLDYFWYRHTLSR